jgi:4-diphosphocytidyl-2-C-methyl-D-erythritol kinase
VMGGIGEVLAGEETPRRAAVLVFPAVHSPTRDVFARLGLGPGEGLDRPHASGNDLTDAAIAGAPAIRAALEALGGQDAEGPRMSGSGSACFGFFADPASAGVAARRISAARPGWWVTATMIG